MDKKEKKRLEVLQQKIVKLQQLLAGAKKDVGSPVMGMSLKGVGAAAGARGAPVGAATAGPRPE